MNHSPNAEIDAGREALLQALAESGELPLGDAILALLDERDALREALLPPRDLTDDGMGNTCSHTSASGVDTTSWSDPSKVWRCDHCGLRWTQDPDGTRVTPPGQEPS